MHWLSSWDEVNIRSSLKYLQVCFFYAFICFSDLCKLDGIRINHLRYTSLLCVCSMAYVAASQKRDNCCKNILYFYA